MPTYRHDHVARSIVAARNSFAQIYKIKSSGFEKIIFQEVSKILAIIHPKGQKLLFLNFFRNLSMITYIIEF